MIAKASTIPGLAHAAAQVYAGRVALEEAGERWTFEELAARALRATRAFMAVGLERGERAAIWAPNMNEWIVAALGLQSAGGVLVPLNTRFKGSEAAYILNKSGARVLCTVSDFLDTDYLRLLEDEDLPALEQRVVLRGAARGAAQSFESFLQRGEAVSEADARARIESLSPDDLSDLLFTSGTTGKPKGVMTTHAQNLRAFEAWSGIVGLNQNDRYLIVNPFFHAFGYKAGWLSCLLRGATILPQPVFDVPTIFERVGRERVSVIPGPPTVYQSFLSHPKRGDYDLSCLRLAVTGAAPTPVELIRRMRDELGFETVITGYGLTETCGIVSMCRAEDSPEVIASTSGRAIDGVEVRCVDPSDPDGKEIARGKPGEVVVRGYNVMKGYFEDPEASAAAVDNDGWLHTGDIAVMDDDGYLEITDRIKDMFIMGGFNCYPAEIENLMYAHPNIAQVAVVGVPDSRMGEVGTAFVVPENGVQIEEAPLLAWCRDHMANYKVPRRVCFLDELPQNASGKVLKFELRRMATDA